RPGGRGRTAEVRGGARTRGSAGDRLQSGGHPPARPSTRLRPRLSAPRAWRPRPEPRDQLSLLPIRRAADSRPLPALRRGSRARASELAPHSIALLFLESRRVTKAQGKSPQKVNLCEGQRGVIREKRRSRSGSELAPNCLTRSQIDFPHIL